MKTGFFIISVLILALSVSLSGAIAQVSGVTGGKAYLETVNKQLRQIKTDDLKKLLKENREVVLVDVRTMRELEIVGGTIDAPQNVTIPRGWLEFRIGDQAKSKDTPIVVYCGTNQRSPLAAATLMKMGYTNVRNYAPGFFGWRKSGGPVVSFDKARNSVLYSLPVKVVEGVYSAIGATAPGTYENSGHNNNLSFVVTSDGVLVVNAGANALLARALHEEIKKITDQPVKYVVLENGQGHAALGSVYWQSQGATVIAHEDAATEIEENAESLMTVAIRRTRDKMIGTRVVAPDKTFTGKMVLQMGDTRIELINLGPAHSPGDIVVWIPGKSVVVSGDMAFHQRLLPVFDHTETGEWIKSWEKFEALGAKHIIPGHGVPTNYAEVRKYTRDYLVYMRTKIGKLIEDGGTLIDAYKIDQSAYEHLHTYKFLARQNAGRIFRAMEFE